MDRWNSQLTSLFAGSSVQEALNSLSNHSRSNKNFLTVPRGQLTFDAEGLEKPGSKFHSRVAHIPSLTSGITIGRGFDLGTHSKGAIRSTLNEAGFDQIFINTAVGASLLRGGAAKRYLDSNPLPEISLKQQYDLFNISYKQMEQDVIRIINRQDVVTTYGKIEWSQLPSYMKELIIDLRYRGDYIPDIRKMLHPPLAKGNYAEASAVFHTLPYWEEKGVPKARIEARMRIAERYHFQAPVLRNLGASDTGS